MQNRPVIGISCYAVQASWGSWHTDAVLLPRRYAEKIAAAGGLPVLLPPLHGVSGVLARLDGLVLSGGGDLEPALYGADRKPNCGPANPDRDQAELDLARQALQRGLPLLGICRGLQVINVALGGTLHQHLPDLVGHDGHSPVEDGYQPHKVSIGADSRLAAVLAGTEAAVPTHHHQSIDRLGAGLVATAWADDGVIEAAELAPAAPGPTAAEPRFMLAVQWHPEAGDDPSLFTALVTAAGRTPVR